MIPALWSCEEVVELELNESPELLTIEAIVEPADAYVILTRSVGFYAANDFAPETQAQVEITDSEGKRFVLRDEAGQGVYRAENWVGQPGLTYSLTVEADGSKYSSVATMPLPVVIDALEVEETPGGPGATEYPYTLSCSYMEPGDTQNFYQIRVVRNEVELSSLILTNDELNNGIRAVIPLFRFQVGFDQGDTARVYLHGIDAAAFRYLNGLAEIAATNPFGNGAVADPQSNITGGALGYFSARTVSVAELVIP